MVTGPVRIELPQHFARHIVKVLSVVAWRPLEDAPSQMVIAVGGGGAVVDPLQSAGPVPLQGRSGDPDRIAGRVVGLVTDSIGGRVNSPIGVRIRPRTMPSGLTPHNHPGPGNSSMSSPKSGNRCMAPSCAALLSHLQQTVPLLGSSPSLRTTMGGQRLSGENKKVIL